ncbi:LOW QUALITY PROTEIN: progranulin-like [Xyrichtys novacula]|uniref:LOW QUALITY PROTEIN: progranulin-like n=1 Tax=Xyrichtys novacula TaxID=13765 RepID=A0AAV1GWF8_XYRNO|nr:LOW QUALITY PROTEIN: progranulin-like [Xyrichtys novacula]
MQGWVVISCALLAMVSADVCPDGGSCKDGQTCCNDPTNGYECCPFDQAECCEDHMHCCPAETLCDTATSSCVNATVTVPWAERTSASKPRLSKSFRMIKSYVGEEDDNICPDLSRCPAEFSCLSALTRFGCCPLAQGIPCSDGKHCCPEGHQCSLNSRSCIKKEHVTTVLCGDGKQECPDGTTCCETSEGMWGCCLLPKAVCCADKLHCCPEGNTCDIENLKCVSPSTKKVTPMWAKFPARTRAEWENQKGRGFQFDSASLCKCYCTLLVVTAIFSSLMWLLSSCPGNDVACNSTAACPDGNTCCKTKEGGWACCPLPEAVCCADFIHCCPKGKKCNLAAETCEDESCSEPLVKKVPTIPLKSTLVGDVTCDSSHKCPDDSTCCKTETGEWACCPLPKAVCCDDHEHCCPEGTICDLATLTCNHTSGSSPIQRKIPALPTMTSTTMQTASRSTAVTTAQRTTAEDERKPEEDEVKPGEAEKERVEGSVQCDPHTSCPQSTTCCFMKSSKKWGCCPLPQAVCCSDGNHCCPNHYKCKEDQTSCIKGEVVIPWYTKLPATASIPANPRSVKCDGQSQCPEHTTCCRLSTGEWGCCPLENAVCCQDKKHCCPQGYTCDIASNSCQKLIMLELETVPLTPVLLPGPQPQLPPVKQKDVKCDEETSCPDGQTCCRMSATTWGCCPFSDAVCCKDMLHCCPHGLTCNEAGECIQKPVFHWQDWPKFQANKKRAVIV